MPYTLENEHVKVALLPELGGKIHGAVDKQQQLRIHLPEHRHQARHGRSSRARGYPAAWSSTGRSTTAPPPSCPWKPPHEEERGRFRHRLDGRSRALPPDARHGGHHRVSRPLLCGSQGCGLQPHRFIRCPSCGGTIWPCGFIRSTRPLSRRMWLGATTMTAAPSFPSR